MKAAVIHAQGGPEVLQYADLPDPQPGPGEVVIANEAISIEGGDLLNRSILPVESFPHVIGYQAAGTVAAVGGGVSRVSVGDRVCGFNFVGSHAEKFLVPEATAFRIPDGLETRLAATIPVTFGTARDALFDFGGLRAGETVFVQGGAGGVGLAAIQLARNAGATVLATARGRRRADRLKDYGAAHGIAYDDSDFAEEVLRLTDDKGADLVVDLAGGDAAAMSKLLSAVAYRGRVSVVGLSSGEAPSIAFWDLVVKNMTIYGVLFGAEMGTPRGQAIIDQCLTEAAAGKLTMPIEREFALSEAAAAHRYIEENRPFGRVLLIP